MNLPPMCKKQSSFHKNEAYTRTTKCNSLKPSVFQRWKKIGQIQNDQNTIQMSNQIGNKKIIKKYSFETKVYKVIPQNLNDSSKSLNSKRQKTVPKSKSTNVIMPNSIISEDSKIRKITKLVPKNKAQHQIKTYEWRMTTHFPVFKVQCKGHREIKTQNPNEIFNQIELQISNIENVKFTLSQVKEFNLLNSIYILNQSLVSFQRLFNKFGYFQPTLKMIFITNNLKCKIWINQNVWENNPLAVRFVSRQSQKVQNFYRKVINMFSNYFKSRISNISDPLKKSLNLIQKLIYQLQQRKDFVQGLKFINDFIHAYSLKLNNKFMYPIQNKDNRSRIWSKLQNPAQQKKLITLKQIPFKKYEIEDQKNIKTLKNSADCYRIIKQSNCKTIQKNSQLFKSNQLQFKKTSIVSICSKKTIVNKKERFSLYQENNKASSMQKNQIKLEHYFPTFKNQDFNQIIDDDESLADTVVKNNNLQTGGEDAFFNLKKITLQQQEEELQQKIRNQIQKKVREQNGWMLSPQILAEIDDCAKSFQDSQPSVKMRPRDRSLTKLNRIKKSIANSIVESNM